MESEAVEVKRAEVNALADAQIAEWQNRNREPGVLPCIPIIMISTLAGDKPGITVNLNKNMPLKDVALILKAASEQVEKAMGTVEGN